jgi:hypothetical protein
VKGFEMNASRQSVTPVERLLATIAALSDNEPETPITRAERQEAERRERARQIKNQGIERRNHREDWPEWSDDVGGKLAAAIPFRRRGKSSKR